MLLSLHRNYTFLHNCLSELCRVFNFPAMQIEIDKLLSGTFVNVVNLDLVLIPFNNAKEHGYTFNILLNKPLGLKILKRKLDFTLLVKDCEEPELSKVKQRSSTAVCVFSCKIGNITISNGSLYSGQTKENLATINRVLLESLTLQIRDFNLFRP